MGRPQSNSNVKERIMASTNCSACESLRENSPNLLVNGLGKTECSSLQNNTGLSASSGHDDCTDLEALNDCLVGNMEQEVETYEVCDWKEFMKNFIPNIWTILKGIICSICGIWTNIDKLWCWVENLAKPQNTGSLTPDDDRVKFRAVSGVESRYDPAHPVASDAPLVIRIVGTTARITGSLHFEGNMPSSYTSGGSTGRVKWLDFFKGQTNIVNQYGRSSYDGNFPTGGVLLYEYEVKGCDWGFTTLYDAPLLPSAAGDFIARIRAFKDGDEYPYDCGWDENGKGQTYHPSSSKYDTLIQVRMMYVNSYGIAHENGNITPNGITMVRPCTSTWEC